MVTSNLKRCGYRKRPSNKQVGKGLGVERRDTFIGKELVYINEEGFSKYLKVHLGQPFSLNNE